MTTSSLSPESLRTMVLYVAGRIEANKDELSRADRAVGDGDHGVAMARGFAAVRAELEDKRFVTAGELLTAVGRALLGSVGGAAGVVFGTLFSDGAAELAGREEFDAEEFRRFLSGGLRGVQRRGRAEPGDKTALDALAPAARAAEKLGAAALDEVLSAAAGAAKEGVERTRSMVARVGKTKALGERSLGHPDPGALSVYLILDAMAEYASGAAEVPGRGGGRHPQPAAGPGSPST